MWWALGITLLGLPPAASAQLEQVVAAAEPETSGVRAALEARLDAVVAAVAPGTPEARARALLRVLHGPGPTGLLATYDEVATTVVDVAYRARFNCVSATALFLIAASALELEGEVELLPTHARARIRIESDRGTRWVLVETTSPFGFDPAPEDRARIAQRVASVGSGRGIVDEAGEQVGFEGLLAATFVNRATVAQEEGDLVEAERLFARGARLAPSPTSRRLLQDQRATLLARLAIVHLERGETEGFVRAQGLLLRARALEPTDGQVRGIVRQNLRAVTERLLRAHVEAGRGERALQARVRFEQGATPNDVAGIRAFLLGERARRAANAGDAVAALGYLDEALSLELNAEEAPLRAVLEGNQMGLLSSAAEQYASEGDLTGARNLLSRTPGLPVSPETWARIYRLAGHALLSAGRASAASDVFREGLGKVPSHPELEQDLSSTLQQTVLPDVREGRCAEAAPVLDEIALYDSRFAGEAGLDCQLVIAQRALSVDNYPEAAAALEKGRKLAPGSSRWRTPLVGVLTEWTLDLVGQGACTEVWPIVRRLTRLDAAVPRDVQRRCPPR